MTREDSPYYYKYFGAGKSKQIAEERVKLKHALRAKGIPYGKLMRTSTLKKLLFRR